MTEHGTWLVHAVDSGDVRLRSGRIGLFTVDVKAPVRHGTLVVDASGVRLDLVLALERLSTGNFLIDRAAKSVVSKNNAHDLTYLGTGGLSASDAQAPGLEVSGHAVAGSIDVELRLTITPAGIAHPMDEIELRGSASLGTVHLPLPGMGTVDDFAFDVDAKLSLQAP